MPKYQPINLIGGFYTDDSLSWAAQDTVNWLPLAAEVEGTRTVTKLRSPPGLFLFSDIGTDPIRETHNVEGRLFTVSGSSLYEVNTSGVETNRGSIPGVGRVSMAHNQITFGNQLTIVNGDSGYVWNTVTSTLTKITDEGFDGSIQVDFLNGFMIHLDPFGRFWFHSQPADALSFNTLDRYTSESSPDNMVGVKVFQSEVVVFNESTIDFFGLTGSGELGGVFERKNIVINRGCASRNSIARVNNTLAWLGDDGAVYILSGGYREQRISTIPIEQAIAGLNWSQAFAEVWEDQGHTIYYLTFPDGRTWGYDFNSGLWTRRESYELNRWRMASITFWQGKWIVGDFQVGKLYELKWDFFTENGRPLVSYRATGYSHSDQNRVLCPYLELMFDTGWAPNPADLDPLGITGDAPDVMVDTGYSYAYAATGGFGIYTFSYTGSLPPGLNLSTDGILSGVPTVTGNYSFTVTVTDSLGNTASVPDTIQVSFSANLFSYTQVGDNITYRSGVDNTYPVIQSFPGIAPPTDWSSTADGEYMMTTELIAPFYHIYRRQISGNYNNLPLALTPSPTVSNSCSMSRDGTYVAIITSTGWRVHKIGVGGNTWPTVVHTSAGVLATAKFSPDSNYLVVGYTGGCTVFRRSGDTFTNIQDIALTNQGVGLGWYKDSSRFVVTDTNNPLRVYGVSGNTVTLLGNSSINSPGLCRAMWSNDGQYVYVRGNSSPFMLAFSWNGTTLTAIANPATLPTLTSPLMGIDATGSALYTGNGAVGGYVYAPGVGGVLTLVSTLSPGQVSGYYVKSGDYPV